MWLPAGVLQGTGKIHVVLKRGNRIAEKAFHVEVYLSYRKTGPYSFLACLEGDVMIKFVREVEV